MFTLLPKNVTFLKKKCNIQISSDEYRHLLHNDSRKFLAVFTLTEKAAGLDKTAEFHAQLAEYKYGDIQNFVTKLQE